MRKDLDLLIENTADKTFLSKAIIEKDYWVCFMLNYLFNQFQHKDQIVFKGGTSLSKCFHLIERFSEDIDLALKWEVLGYDKNAPYLLRSKTAQQKFNAQLEQDTKTFLTNLLPTLKADFSKFLKEDFDFYVDDEALHFQYPQKHKSDAILQTIKLEIGCLSEFSPYSTQEVQSYIDENYSQTNKIKVTALSPIRTFFEKATILHREANRINNRYPARYSRHFYDLYKMLVLKEETLNHLNVLQEVIDFKDKFYPCNFANYSEILTGKLKLIPPEKALIEFNKDYEAMKSMIYGEIPNFDEIISSLHDYEKEINLNIELSNELKNNNLNYQPK